MLLFKFLDFFDEIEGDNFLSFFLKVFKMLTRWAEQLWTLINSQIEILGYEVYFWELLVAIGAVIIIIRIFT